MLLLSALVIVRWPTDGEIDAAGLRARALFALIGYTALGCVVLLVPAFPATSIVRERRNGTLALLFNTPIPGPWIYCGKLLGILTCVAWILVMSAPAVSACYAMGGIGFSSDIVLLYTLLVLVSVQYVAMSLWVSRFASTPVAAIRTAYSMVLVFSVLSLGPALLVPPSAAGLFASAAKWLMCLSPIPPAMEILGRSVHGSLTDVWIPSTLGRFALLAGISTLCFAVHVSWTMNPALFDRARAAGTMTQDRSLFDQRFRRVFFLVDPQRRSRGIPDWLNPLVLKEFRSRRFGRGHWLMRLVAGCAVLSLALTYVATTGSITWTPETIGGVLVLLQTALILVFVPSLASGLISDERESGGWTLLRITPLTAGQIVRGKLMSVAWTVSLVLLATLPGYAIMMLIKPVLRQQVLAVLATLVFMAGFATCASAAISSLFRRTAPATITAYLILVVMLVGPLVVWLGRDAPFGHAIVEQFLTLSPIAAALSLIEAPGFENYRLIPAAWWVVVGGILVSITLILWKTHQLTKPE
jgi:ABC-type transport system involved in multi-copper enzyme maturation permease subunit